jgi:phospholipid/cholesterol/gamma-HCH transport system substrate-binding protein
MNRSALELWVGLFVIAGLAALAMLALQVGNLGMVNVTDSYKVTASFGNVGGLNIKAPVTMAGVKIGRVSNIQIDREDYSAIVELSIDRRYNNLPTDTSAAVLTSGLLGAQYVGLEPGGEDTYLEQGDRIEITQSAVVLEQLIGQMLFSKAQGDG